MNISAPFIKRPIGTTLIAIGILVAGIFTDRLLPVAAVPNIPMPAFVVLAQEPGANPQTMASTVAAPLERQLGKIPGLYQIMSFNSVGASNVVLLFSHIGAAARDAAAIQAGINAALPNLPANLPSRPYYKEFNPASRPILTMALTSRTLRPGAVYDAADTILAERLAQVSGVALVQINGAQSPAVRVNVHPAALARAGLTATDVYTAIRAANVLSPLGDFRGNKHDSVIVANGQLHTARQYRRIVLEAHGAAIVRLGDVATVVSGVTDTELAAWDGSRPAVLITITKTPDANVIATVDAIKKRLPEIRRALPADIHLHILTDRTTTIRASVHDIEITLLITVVLVLVVVWAFMRRGAPTIAAGVTVPLSIAGTLAAMWALGFSLDNFSLMALTISVGFVVDDAIVMIENIMTYHEAGLSPLEAALRGSRQIGFTVVSITLSLIAVFIPLTLMPGIVGELFHEFAMTLTLAIAISAFISLTVTPMICAHFLRPDPAPPAPRSLSAHFARWYAHIAAAYERSLDWSLRHRRLMLAVTAATIVATIALYIRVPKGFLPEEDTGLVIGNTIAGPDISFARMETLQRRVVAVLLKDRDVATVSSSIGVANGFTAANNGKLFIGLTPRSDRKLSARAILAQLRPKLARIAGIQTYLFVAQDIFVGGQSTNGQYDFTILDPSLQSLATVTHEIDRRIAKLPGIRSASSDQDKPEPQITIAIDRKRAARLGVTVAAIDDALNNAYAQRQISRIYNAENQYQVVLKVPHALGESPEQLNHIYVAGSAGPVLLTAVAHFVRTSVPLSVRHYDGLPEATISFNLARGAVLGTVIHEIQKTIAGMPLPSGVRARFGGNARFFLRSIEAEPLLILAALAAIYIVLGVLYESLSQPLTILSTLPSAGVGALLALIFTGLPLTVIAIIGIFLLMGIVKKNGIMLVDFALEAERTLGLSPEQAIRTACLKRFRPILMTTLAALLGAVPLALAFGTGHHLRQPIGITVIGGLIVSQALTLYTTPIIYLALGRWSRRRALVSARPGTMPL
ncbi:efflux RND transporter permease subunit [Acidiferrobacter sp.]|uniref:efflux RND transporter permease subunit n=1 Tax=Acidiferrobacter sp. TaxID=1872107 RepID=UPI00260FC3C7|nr:efflux RND transporter permease subunit [Acidiferrobacter sp.]